MFGIGQVSMLNARGLPITMFGRVCFDVITAFSQISDIKSTTINYIWKRNCIDARPNVCGLEIDGFTSYTGARMVFVIDY